MGSTFFFFGIFWDLKIRNAGLGIDRVLGNFFILGFRREMGWDRIGWDGRMFD